jgi:hypothetical protein
MNRLRFINDTGLGLLGAEKDKIKDLRVYEENGSVQLWVETADMEYLQYLSAQEAMSFALAFERLAVIALKKQAEFVGG